MRKRITPTVQAGSMADIAFLLLLFFLVSTTIPKDQGIVRALPRPCLTADCMVTLNERNILRIRINKQGELLIEEQPMAWEELPETLRDFIDNNGLGQCDYCQGAIDPLSSDGPTTAVISLRTERETAYGDFISVQAAISSVYFELRRDYAENYLKTPIKELSEEQLQVVKDAYPLLLSEADLR